MALDVSRLKAMTEGYSSLGHRTDNSILEVSLEKIERDESQPRKRFNEETLQELADSIREYGLIQPIVVRKSRIHWISTSLLPVRDDIEHHS